MAAHRQVYDSRHQQAGCQEPDREGISSGTLRSVIEYGSPLPLKIFLMYFSFQFLEFSVFVIVTCYVLPSGAVVVASV